MSKHRRYLAEQVRRDLKKKMVFVAGPRQVGKTTLARSLPGAAAGYLNWDVAEHREHLLRRELPAGRLWIFDEIHKYRAWRGYLKGLFDNRTQGQQIRPCSSNSAELSRRPSRSTRRMGSSFRRPRRAVIMPTGCSMLPDPLLRGDGHA